MKRLSHILNIFLFILLVSCKPKQEATSFNSLISVPIGDNLSFDVLEDHELTINYSVPSQEDSINLELFISSNPQNGTLKNCNKETSNSFVCTYKPKEDFSGVDTFQVKTKDGDLVSSSSSTIIINVIPQNDAPLAYAGSTSGKENETILISLPIAKDVDTSANNLTYSISSNPSNGTLDNCLVAQGNRTCEYTANHGIRGLDSFTYIVTDSDGLISNTAEFQIQVNDPNFLQGLETFTQDVSQINLVEVVWVIDNSGSMSGEQATLKQNFSSFIQNFIDNGKAKFPFNMGIITSDTYFNSYQNQAFASDDNGNPYVLTHTRAEAEFDLFKADFEKAVEVGIKGSGSEKMLKSIEMSRSYSPSWYSSSDSLLVYILLTDEHEQSTDNSVVNTETSNTNILEWHNLFNSWKQESNRIKIYPIINTNSNRHDRFGEIARLSGTSVYDITKPFDAILNDISTEVTNLVDSFTLKSNITITESTIKVYVNNVLVSSSDWLYVNNAIRFVTAPPSGSTIRVTYDYY